MGQLLKTAGAFDIAGLIGFQELPIEPREIVVGAAGAEAGVGSTYNYAAPLYHRMIAAFRQGDMETARKLQLLSQKLVLLLMRFGGSAGKQIMELIGQPVGPVRPPTRNTFETNAELAAALRAIGVAPYLGGELVIGDRIGA